MLAVIVDQWVKYWVAGHIPFETGIIRLIPGVMSIVNIHNDGAAFSFLAGGGARIWFILICGVFTVLVILALATNMISGKVGRWSAVMVAAGGIGNAIDRMLYGYVQDMFKVEFFNFAVFNVADIFITVFCIVFILYVIFGTRSTDDDDDEEDEPAPVEEKPKKQKKVKEEVETTSRKEKQKKHEDEYRAFEESKKTAKAAKKAAAESAPAEKPKKAAISPAKAVKDDIDSKDPFSDWEEATIRFERKQKQQAAELSGSAASKLPEETPVVTGRHSAGAAKPAAKPAPRTAAKPAEDDFDLDSILNEFK